MIERFQVDPRNPGEILACAGLAWLADHSQPGIPSGFILNNGRCTFEISFPAEAINEIIRSVPEEQGNAVVVGRLRLDWWRFGWGLNPAFKFWAGQQSARSVLTNLVNASREGDPTQWSTYMAPTTGRLGVDPRGTWDSLSLGWSINEHSSIQYLCRPYVEWLAFLALQVFPVQGDRSSGLRYHLWQSAPLTLATLAFAGVTRHSLSGYIAEIDSSGSNKTLKPSRNIQE